MKKYLKLFITILILLGGICYASNVFATTENYDYVKTLKDFKYEFKIKAKNGEDITKQLVGYLEESKDNVDSSNYAMIYIPSGTYYLSDDNNLVLHSCIYIVAEDDTRIIKNSSSSKDSLIRTRKSENTKNCTIFGGIWNGNHKAKHGLEINNAKDVNIYKVTVGNCKNNGIYINNKSNVNIDSCIVRNNEKSGIAIYTNSMAILRETTIAYNSEYGICISGASTLESNNMANNQVIYNDWSGISATGRDTKIYLYKNIISYNGRNAKNTESGKVGHGIGVSEHAYANIINNTIQNNKECGISIFDNAEAKINKNKISGNGRHGIGARQEVIMELYLNNIYKNSYNGILLADRSEATLCGDKLSTNSKFGLSVVDYSEAELTSTEICKNRESNISISEGDEKRDKAKVTLQNNNKIYSSKNEHGIVISGKTKLYINGKDNKIYKNKKNGISSTGSKAEIKIKGKTYLTSNIQSGIYIKSSKADISNVTISSNLKYGISVEGKGNLTLKKSTIKENKNYGINVSGSGTKAKIENNNIYRNVKVGIMVKDKANVSSIYKNTLNQNGQTGIHIKGKAKVASIKKNKITKHTKYGIAIYESKKPKMTDNKLSNPKAKKQTYYKK